jgi:GntR family transcriptional repressor for pyruvate dehydrogenase complex
MSLEIADYKATFNKVKRGSIAEEIIDLFRQKLLAGELKLGERLPTEKQLVEQLGVSRSALRETIKMMAALGVIEVRQGEGSFITREPSASLLNPLVFAVMLQAGVSRDLLELRTLLEVGYCQLASEKATDEDLHKIEQTALYFEELAEQGDIDADSRAQADLDFHSAIIDATHNPLIIQISKTVEELFFSSIRSTISKIEGLVWGIEGHRRIIEAIKRKDHHQIRQAVVLSLERWRMELGE